MKDNQPLAWMDVHYTKHARDQREERNVEEVWIEETIKSPE